MAQFYAALYLLAADMKGRLRRQDRSATAVESGLLVGLTAEVIIVAVTALGGQLNTLFQNVTCNL
jgi:pilus assembly protein Flp/PilA